MPKTANGKTPVLQFHFPEIWPNSPRLSKAAGTNDPKEIAGIKLMMSHLYTAREFSHIRSIKSGRLSLLTLYHQWKHQEMAKLPSVDAMEDVRVATTAWLADYEGVSENTRSIYRQNFKKLFEKADASAKVADLPSLLASYRKKMAKADTRIQFNNTRVSVLSYLSNTVGEHSQLYRDTSEVEKLSSAPKREGNPLRYSQVVALCETLRKDIASAVWTLCLTGMNWQEFTSFTVEDDHVQVNGTKQARKDNRRHRKVPLVGKPQRPTVAQKAFRLHLKATGVKDVQVYDFRRTYVTWLLDAGIDMPRIRQYMGHAKSSSRDMTARYAQRRIDDYVKEDGERLSAWLESQRLKMLAAVTVNPNVGEFFDV